MRRDRPGVGLVRFIVLASSLGCRRIPPPWPAVPARLRCLLPGALGLEQEQEQVVVGGLVVVGGGGERPLETTGDHRGQFPRTDLGPVTEPSPPPTPPGPLKLRLFRGVLHYKMNMVDLTVDVLQIRTCTFSISFFKASWFA